jgi:hypothetical protein
VKYEARLWGNTKERYTIIKTRSATSCETIHCAIYARTASATATEIDVAIVEQVNWCRQAAKMNGWTVAKDCIRIDHGSMQERRGLQELLALAATKPRPFDYVTVC